MWSCLLINIIHINLQLIYLARENNVHIMCLPPNLTHITQLLDISVFHPLKQTYFKFLKEFKTKTLAANVSKAAFPSFLHMLWNVSFKLNHLCSGFRAAGIHPLNQQAITNTQLETGVPFQRPSSTDEPTCSTSSYMWLDLGKLSIYTLLLFWEASIWKIH